VDLPRVSPTGILEIPRGYRARPAKTPRRLKIIAAVVLLSFLLVGIATTALSLGRYCLTTDTSNTSALPARPKGEKM
jgi:hypothetical protein